MLRQRVIPCLLLHNGGLVKTWKFDNPVYVGDAINAVRKTLGARKRDIGVSASLISQIETDKSHPSVSTLYAITTALDITVESLFDEPDTSARPAADPAGVPHLGIAPPEPAHPGRRPQRDRQQRQRCQPIVRPAERESLTLDSGVIWERLGQVPNTHADFLQITYGQPA